MLKYAWDCVSGHSSPTESKTAASAVHRKRISGAEQKRRKKERQAILTQTVTLSASSVGASTSKRPQKATLQTTSNMKEGQIKRRMRPDNSFPD